MEYQKRWLSVESYTAGKSSKKDIGLNRAGVVESSKVKDVCRPIQPKKQLNFQKKG